jgi:hypothetical protein
MKKEKEKQREKEKEKEKGIREEEWNVGEAKVTREGEVRRKGEKGR